MLVSKNPFVELSGKSSSHCYFGIGDGAEMTTGASRTDKLDFPLNPKVKETVWQTRFCNAGLWNVFVHEVIRIGSD